MKTMHEIARYKGVMARRCAKEKSPYGMGLGEGLSSRAEAVIIYGSGFADPGEDFTRMVAFDKEGIKLATITLHGY
jgi:hypothetical protein